MGRWRDWMPALMLAAGLVLVESSRRQDIAALRAPLDDALPAEIEGYAGSAIEVPAAEVAAAGATSHVFRAYRKDAATPFFTLYVGYYASQTQGRTIHSPRNCLPGGGWEALSHAVETVPTRDGPIEVARYLIQKDGEQALVLYWYQGRGRVESGEYAVKWQLLRDAALRGRTEEALVRVMVPIAGDAAPSLDLAQRVTRLVVPALFEALPEV